MRHNNLMPMRLQFFASPDGAGAGSGNGGGDGAGSAGDPGSSNGNESGAGNEPLSFDDFLNGEGNQAEFDRRVQKAIDTAISKNNERWKVLSDEKATEAEKLAKMTQAEKTEYLNNKKLKELDDREAEITRRELMATAKNTLTDKGLPLDLAEVLVYSDAEACNKSISAVEKAFQAAVEAAVKERLKGSDPMKKAPNNDIDDLSAQILKAMEGGI